MSKDIKKYYEFKALIDRKESKVNEHLSYAGQSEKDTSVMNQNYLIIQKEIEEIIKLLTKSMKLLNKIN